MANVTMLENGQLVLRCSFPERFQAKDAGGRWSKPNAGWVFPGRTHHLQRIIAAFPNALVHKDIYAALQTMNDREGVAYAAKREGWENATPDEPMPLNVTPFQHQVLGFNIGLALPHHALLMEMGTGKTLTELAIAARRWQRGEVERMLVVAPATVLPVWGADAQMVDVPIVSIVLNKSVAKSEKLLAQFTPFPIVCPDCHGDGAHVDDDGAPGGCFRCGTSGRVNPLQIVAVNYEKTWRMIDALKAWQPDLIVCDESQRIKKPGARQSMAMHSLGKLAEFRSILTGTPVPNRPLEFYSQYKFLDETIFGPSHVAFTNRYAIQKGGGGMGFADYLRLDELTRLAHSVAYRVTKDEALDLPEWLDREIDLELEPAARKTYDQVEKAAFAELTTLAAEGTITTPHVLTSMLRLSQITGGFVGDDEGQVHHISSAKLKALGDIADDVFDSGKKIVVFARFRAEIEAITKRLQGSLRDPDGVPGEVLEIHGGIPIPKRGGIVDRFQDPDGPRAIVVQTRAGGLGITLTAADTAVFFSLDYSFENYDQARARIHRIGQKNHCTYIHLMATNTIDQKVLQALRDKRDLAAVVVDGWRDLFNKETK